MLILCYIAFAYSSLPKDNISNWYLYIGVKIITCQAIKKSKKNLSLQQKSHFQVFIALKWLIIVKIWWPNLKPRQKCDNFHLSVLLGKDFIASQNTNHICDWRASKNGVDTPFLNCSYMKTIWDIELKLWILFFCTYNVIRKNSQIWYGHHGTYVNWFILIGWSEPSLLFTQVWKQYQ